MNIIKTTFGFMLLAVAIVFVERLWNSDYSMLLWSALGLGAFSYYQVVNQPSAATFAKGVRSLVIFLGLFVSAMLGYNALFGQSGGHYETSGASTGVTSQSTSHPEFMVVKNLEGF